MCSYFGSGNLWLECVSVSPLAHGCFLSLSSHCLCPDWVVCVAGGQSYNNLNDRETTLFVRFSSSPAAFSLVPLTDSCNFSFRLWCSSLSFSCFITLPLLRVQSKVFTITRSPRTKEEKQRKRETHGTQGRNHLISFADFQTPLPSNR